MTKQGQCTRFLLLCALLLQAIGAHANTCIAAKRTSVSAVCGRVINSGNEMVQGVTLTLTSDADNATLTIISDDLGNFSFHSVAKEDYTLRAVSSGYSTAVRQLRVSRNTQTTCPRKIVVSLGLGSCTSSISFK